MKKSLNVVALVLARGGSKGLPGKNLKKIRGRTLIEWSIATAQGSKYINQIYCSTDSEDIAIEALRCSAIISFKRPDKYSTDSSTDLDVFTHFIEHFAEQRKQLPDIIVQLRPTTPFRSSIWVDEMIENMLGDPSATCVRTISKANFSPYKMWRYSSTDRIVPVAKLDGYPEAHNSPRQVLPETYFHTGQIDVIKTSTIKQNSMTGQAVLGYQTTVESHIDIDSQGDFDEAEQVSEALYKIYQADHENMQKSVLRDEDYQKLRNMFQR